MTALGRLLNAGVAKLGSHYAIAEAIGISHSALMRARKQPGFLGTDALLRLAEAIGEDPDVVLRAGGRADVADQIKRMYGRPAKPLSAVDRRLMALAPKRKRAVLGLFS